MKERKKTNALRAMLLCLALGAAAVLASSCGGGSGSTNTGSTGFQPTGGYTTPWGMTLNSSGSRLYVANNVSNYISVYDTSNMKELKRIKVACRPRYLALNGDESRLYVTHDDLTGCQYSQTSYDLMKNGYITVIDLSLEKVTKEVSIDEKLLVSARDIIYDPDHDVFYVLSPSNIVVFDPGTDTAVGKVPYVTAATNGRIRYDSGNGFLYVINYGGAVKSGSSESEYIVDVLIPDDPKSLTFSQPGYNAQTNSHCLCTDTGGKCDKTNQRTNCECNKNSNCNSNICFGGAESSESFLLPYCKNAECATDFASDTTTINCLQTDSGDSCQTDTTLTSNSCVGTEQANICSTTVTSEILCSSDTVCQDGYSCSTFYKNCKTPRSCLADPCKIGFACKDGVCVASLGIDCVPPNDSTCTNMHTCNTSTSRCETDCSSDYDCEGDGYFCDTSSGLCLKNVYSDSFCASGYSCNENSGYCEKNIYLDELCLEDGYSCNSTSGKCEKTVTTFTECTEEGYTCNESTGTCETTYPTDSLCDTATGYECEAKTAAVDEDEYICRNRSYYNGCSCDSVYNCIGDNVGCSNTAGCFTYVKMLSDSVAGYCDREAGLCYNSTIALDYWGPLKKIVKCSHPADLLVLPDETAYLTCYGKDDGDQEEDDDPILRLVWDEDGLARNGSVMATRDSFNTCNKPTKMALSTDGSVAFIICFGERKLFAIDVYTGDIIKEYFTPQNPVDIVVSSKYVFVSGSTTNDIARFAVPSTVNTNVLRQSAGGSRLSDFFLHAPLQQKE